MVPTTASNRFNASFSISKRHGKFGPYHTGWDEYTTWHGSKELSGSVTYTTDESAEDKLDLHLRSRTSEPILRRDGAYVRELGTKPGNEHFVLNDEDIAETEFDGRTFEVEFLPGRELKSFKLDTKTGKVKIKDQGDWLIAGWKTQARIERR